MSTLPVQSLSLPTPQLDPTYSSRKKWIFVGSAFGALLLLLCVAGGYHSVQQPHRSPKIVAFKPEFKKFFFSTPVHVPSCVATFSNTSVGYSTVFIQVKDKLGNTIPKPPSDLHFTLTISPQTIPDFHEVIPDPVDEGFKLSYHATVASYKSGAGVPPEYSLDGNTVLFTVSITETNSGEHIKGSPFQNSLYISPHKSPAMPQRSNTDLPKVLGTNSRVFAGDTVRFHIFARDSFAESTVWSNLLESSDDTFNVSILHKASGTLIEPVMVPAVDGIHPVEFSARLSGSYSIAVAVKSADSWTPIAGSVEEPNPFDFEILHGASSVSLSSTDLNETMEGYAGVPLKFKVRGKDIHGNELAQPDSFRVAIEDEILNTTDTCETLELISPGLFEASCILTIANVNASSKINVYTTLGELVGSSSIIISPGPLNINSTQIEGVELIKEEKWRFVTKTSVSSSLILTMYDSYSNRLPMGGEKIEVFAKAESSTPTEPTVEVEDKNDGSYEVKFLATSPAYFTIFISVNGEKLSFGTENFLNWTVEPDSDIYIKKIYPPAGPVSGDTEVTFYTSLLYKNSRAVCWFGTKTSESQVSAIIAEDGESLRCVAPAANSHGIVNVGFFLRTPTMTMEATWNSFFYYSEAAVPKKAEPIWLDTKSGEMMQVEADNIVETGAMACKFYSDQANALISEPVITSALLTSSGNAIQCQAPTVPGPCTLLLDISLNSQQYSGSPITVPFIDDFSPQAPALTFTTQEDTPIIIDITNSAKVAHGVLNVGIGENPSNGDLKRKDGSLDLTYTPNKRFFGQDQFTYVISDEKKREVNGVVTLTVQRSMAGPSLSFPPELILNFTSPNSLELGKRFEGVKITDPALFYPLSDGSKIKLLVILQIQNGTFELSRSLKNTLVIDSKTRDNVHSLSFECDLQMANLVISHIVYRPILINGFPIGSKDELFIQIQEIGSKNSQLQLLGSDYTIPIRYILPYRLQIGSWLYNYSFDIFVVFFVIFAISEAIRRSIRKKKKEEVEKNLQSNWAYTQGSSKPRKHVRSYV